MRRGIRGAFVRAAGWAILVSLSSLVIALLVGVGGFRAFDSGAHAAPVRIARSTHPAELLLEAMHRAEHAQAVAPPTDTLAVPWSMHASVVQAQLVADATAEPTARTSATLAIQAQPQQLSLATPPLKPGDRITVPVSFYYCQDGPGNYPLGDGGGFCGVMRDGVHVYSGAAACAYQYLGQLFKILGDPTGRIYKCADTGSAIHGLHRDIWFNNSDDGWLWQHAVGRTAVIEILP